MCDDVYLQQRPLPYCENLALLRKPGRNYQVTGCGWQCMWKGWYCGEANILIHLSIQYCFNFTEETLEDIRVSFI
jgi:hypothetical protein